MSSGQGLAIEKNLAKYDVKVLAAETRKQVREGNERESLLKIVLQ